jgi:hypothetical protein
MVERKFVSVRRLRWSNRLEMRKVGLGATLAPLQGADRFRPFTQGIGLAASSLAGFLRRVAPPFFRRVDREFCFGPRAKRDQPKAEAVRPMPCGED